MEDINAKYASERAAWLKEKEALQNALAQATRSSPMSLSEFDADVSCFRIHYCNNLLYEVILS